MTLGRFTEEKDIDRIIEVLTREVNRIRALSPLTPSKFLEQIKEEEK